jgi:HAD superfamily hydrolase (TIGR01490 family)
VRTIAAFDFDGTLLQGDCLLLFHRLLRGPVGMMLGWIRLLPALLNWKAGRRSTAWFKQHYLAVILAGTETRKRQQVLEHDLPKLLIQRLRPEAVARFRWHAHQGHRLVIVSASPRALIQPVAHHLGAALIATETNDLAGEAPNASVQLTSPNCKGTEKVRRLEAWLGQPLQEFELHAYGDSRGDRELLQAACEPHWRSFNTTLQPYPQRQDIQLGWVPLLGLVLLALAITGLLHLEPETRLTLVQGLRRLPLWLPAIYAALAMAYLGRYWRWRLLLGSEAIGRWSLQDARAWFAGFALTATPGKLGELSRVTSLHQQLGYPRAPLLHVFVAERLCDLMAVGLWLFVLLPPSLGSLAAMLSSRQALAGIAAGLLILLIGGLWCRHRWRRHLPSGAMARACLPATAVSLGIWVCESMILWLLVQALSPAHPINFNTAIVIYLLSGTAGMLSSLPGGIGVNEAAATLLLQQAGLPTALALSIAILRRICTVWSITGLAIWQGLTKYEA